MQVILEIVSGSTAGQRIRLQRGQIVNVGSSAWNDFVVPDDSGVAPKHFIIDVREGICRFRDTSGGYGALVNGQTAAHSILHDGDQIRAGVSDFRVRIVGDSASPTTSHEAPDPVPAPEKSPPRGIGGQYVRADCGTGVIRYSGSVDEVAPAEMARLVNARQSLHLLIDPRRVDLPPLEGQDQPAYLFDWLGEAAAENSPVLLSDVNVSADEGGDLPSVLESSWGKNGAVAIFCKSPKPELLEILRTAARPKPDSLLGFCWPSLLSPLLENGSAEFDLPGALFESISALLIEAAEGKAWILYTPRPIDNFLQSHGLRPASATQDDAAERIASSAAMDE